MKRLLASTICSAIVSIAFSQKTSTAEMLLPAPVELKEGTGWFEIKPTTSIEVSMSDPDTKRVAEFLSKKIAVATGFPMHVASKNSTTAGDIHLSILSSGSNEVLGREGYNLTVTTSGVSIMAHSAAGLFYGLQTLLQLFPHQIESKTVVNMKWKIPAVTITDYPRFGWRGVLFDVSRHFFTISDLKQFIDEIVRYKYNLLHLHLTDDNGWRIEIKSLPNLTKIGAWRALRVGRYWTFSVPSPDEPRTDGGFYTQDEIRELIRYAADRFVTILPEVDVPGHSLSEIASYPELSCTPGKYFVSSGQADSVQMDNTLCPAREGTFVFLDKVFTEIANLFPFEYIHMGGDECDKTFWAKSDEVKQLMQKEGLKNYEEVQSYFVKRVEKILNSKGKKLIGWDEILEGGLAPDATVMSWRGVEGGIQAGKMGHKIVMSPTTYCYVDLYQGDPVVEPPTYGILRLKDSYKFDPVPDGVESKYVLGGQANLWTEQVSNMRHAEYMLWPRGFAIAESVWSPKEKKNWNNFVTRVEKQFARFDAAETKYSKSMYDVIFNPSRDEKGKLRIGLETEVEGLDIFYSFDESNPDKFYPAYTKPLSVPKDAGTLKVITYRNGKPIGKQINMPIKELEARLTAK